MAMILNMELKLWIQPQNSTALQMNTHKADRVMRLVAEKELCEYPNFKSVAGSAENTTLPDNSVDFITTAQAFHWFAAIIKFLKSEKGLGINVNET